MVNTGSDGRPKLPANQGATYIDGAALTVAYQTCYLAYDHLGSVRVVTDEAGDVVAWHDYVPFGEEILPPDGGRGVAQSGTPTFGVADRVYQRFTGQFRDSETSLDYFESRYLGSALGRFTSPDEPFAGQDADDPQSWNMYSLCPKQSATLHGPGWT